MVGFEPTIYAKLIYGTAQSIIETRILRRATSRKLLLE